MTASAKRSRKSLSFKYPARVDVSRAEFVPLASLRHLDVVKLARAARAEIVAISKPTAAAAMF
ncbi:MAG: hypothetical protein ACR2G6_05080 [Gemmatimonadaceae bacterium]